MYKNILSILKWIKAASRLCRSIFSLPAMISHSSMLTTLFLCSCPYLIRSFWNMRKDSGVTCSRTSPTSDTLCRIRSKHFSSSLSGSSALMAKMMLSPFMIRTYSRAGSNRLANLSFFCARVSSHWEIRSLCVPITMNIACLPSH